MEHLCPDLHFVIDQYLDHNSRVRLRSCCHSMKLPYWRISYRRTPNSIINSRLRLIESQPLVSLNLNLSISFEKGEFSLHLPQTLEKLRITTLARKLSISSLPNNLRYLDLFNIKITTLPPYLQEFSYVGSFVKLPPKLRRFRWYVSIPDLKNADLELPESLEDAEIILFDHQAYDLFGSWDNKADTFIMENESLIQKRYPVVKLKHEGSIDYDCRYIDVFD